MVRALTSHQCGSGSIPGLGVICGLSLLLVLVFAPRVFLRVLRFPLSSKTNISKFQFDPESDGYRFVSHNRLFNVTLVKQSRFISSRKKQKRQISKYNYRTRGRLAVISSRHASVQVSATPKVDDRTYENTTLRFVECCFCCVFLGCCATQTCRKLS